MQETQFNLWVRKISWNRKCQLAPVFLPGKFHGQRSLVGYSPWGHKELDTTYRLNKHHFLKKIKIQKGLDLPKQIEMKFRSPNSIFLAVWSSLIVVHRFSCGMHMRSQFPNQGSNPFPLNCKAESQSLDHQGSPIRQLTVY